MLRFTVAYALSAVFTFGFLTGFDNFVDEAVRMGPLECAGRAAVWPFTLGQLSAGWLLAEPDIPGDADTPEADDAESAEDEDADDPRPAGPARIAGATPPRPSGGVYPEPTPVSTDPVSAPSTRAGRLST